MPWFNVSVSRSELSKLMNSMDAWDGKKRLAVEQALQVGIKGIQRQAKQRAPVRSGKLKKTMKQKYSNGKMQGMVFSNLPYAHLVEFGSKAHTIQPKNKKVLKIPTQGGHFFTKAASIPKISARPFLKPAYEYEEQNIINGVKKALEKDEKIT